MVSIIIPAYNSEPFIEKCLNSVCNQTTKDIEAIVVDDGSDDSTVELVEKLQRKYSIIKLLKEHHGGVTRARKLGLKKAVGEFVCFLDSDDYMEPDMITVLRDNIENADLISAGVFEEYYDGSEHEYYDDLQEGVTIGRGEVASKILWDEKTRVLHPITPWIWNKMYRTKKALEVMERIPDTVLYGEDTLFVMAYILKSDSIKSLHKCLYHYGYHNESVIRGKDVHALSKINDTYVEMLRIIEGYESNCNLKKQVDKWFQSNVLRAIYTKFDVSDVVKRTNLLPQLSFLSVNIYGAGDYGHWLYDYYRGLGITIKSWVDKRYSTLDEDIENPEVLLFNGFPVVVAVADKKIYESIYKELSDAGVDSKRICWGMSEIKYLYEVTL